MKISLDSHISLNNLFHKNLNPMHDVTIVRAICIIINLVANVIIATWFCIELRRHQRAQNDDSSHTMRGLAVFSVVAEIGFALIQFFATLEVFQATTDMTSIKIIASLVNVITLVSTMIFYVLRLKISFKDSVYAPTNKTLFIYLIFVFFIFCLFVFSEISSIQITTDISNDNAHVSSLQLFGAISMIIGLALFGLLMSHVTSFFTKRLLELVESSSEERFGINNNININNNNSDNSSSDRFRSKTVGLKINYNKNQNKNRDGHGHTRGHGHSVDFNIAHQLRHSKSQQDLVRASLTSHQHILLKTIAKQSLLILITDFFIVFNCIILGIKYWIKNNDTSSIKNEGSFNFYLVRIIEILSSCIYCILPLTIWFSFVFASREYFVVCRRCHDYTEHICGVIALWKHEKKQQARLAQLQLKDKNKNKNKQKIKQKTKCEGVNSSSNSQLKNNRNTKAKITDDDACDIPNPPMIVHANTQDSIADNNRHVTSLKKVKVGSESASATVITTSINKPTPDESNNEQHGEKAGNVMSGLVSKMSPRSKSKSKSNMDEDNLAQLVNNGSSQDLAPVNINENIIISDEKEDCNAMPSGSGRDNYNDHVNEFEDKLKLEDNSRETVSLNAANLK